MTLSEEALERLADIVELQPTKNADLQDRWDMESGSEVHSYLESELKEHYYRNDNSLICATPDAVSLVGGDPSGQSVTVTPLQSAILDVIAGPEDRSQSVVSVLHDLEEAGQTADVDEVRSALRGLVDRGVVERIKRSVPTFRLAVGADDLDVQVVSDEDEGDETDGGDASEGNGNDADGNEGDENEGNGDEKTPAEPSEA